ncbi:Uma2 family endonuclease [Crocosphaera sp.]|uniref:Uma2 family endonuclease n=1 Tax=Crocosphaera sp. TaxID=2729996 RepID=UPI003F21C69E
MSQTSEKIFSFEDYCTYRDESDHRYELVDGKLVLMNPPSFQHLLIAKFLEGYFDQLIREKSLPLLCFKEAGVRTGWRKSRISDLCIIEANIIQELLGQSAIVEIAPLLIVEIISPESRTRDYRYKRSEYAALGVDEYWIVDPINKTITILLLEEGLYEETVYHSSDQLVSRLFSKLDLTVDHVLLSGNL